MNKFWQKFPIFMVAALAVQYVLGMIVNMYVDFPDGVNSWDVAHNTPVLMLHVALGGTIVLGAIVYLIVLIAKKQRQLLAPAIAGLVFVLAAFVSGEIFMDKRNDTFSMIMAISFLLAMGAYGSSWRLSDKIFSSLLSLKK